MEDYKRQVEIDNSRNVKLNTVKKTFQNLIRPCRGKIPDVVKVKKKPPGKEHSQYQCKALSEYNDLPQEYLHLKKIRKKDISK